MANHDRRSPCAPKPPARDSTNRHPRIQILTIEELLAGKGIDAPPLCLANVTFKKAPRAKDEQTHEQLPL
jgi:hypothetical protein